MTKSTQTKKLVHDLSKCIDVSYYIAQYDMAFLRKELKTLSEQADYPYEPAKLILVELDKITNV